MREKIFFNIESHLQILLDKVNSCNTDFGGEVIWSLEEGSGHVVAVCERHAAEAEEGDFIIFLMGIFLPTSMAALGTREEE